MVEAPPTRPDPPTWYEIPWVAPLACAVVAMAMAAPSANFQFLVEDAPSITGNELFAPGGGWMALLAHPYPDAYSYRPLAALLDAATLRFGLRLPGAFHLVTAHLHAAIAALMAWVAILTWRVLRPDASRGSLALAGLVAGLTWAVHPMLAEVVGFSSVRSQMLAVGLSVLAIVMWCRSLRCGCVGRAVMGSYVWLVALGFGELALLAPLLFVPFALVLRPQWCAQPRKMAAWLGVSMAAIAFAYGMARGHALGSYWQYPPDWGANAIARSGGASTSVLLVRDMSVSMLPKGDALTKFAFQLATLVSLASIYPLYRLCGRHLAAACAAMIGIALCATGFVPGSPALFAVPALGLLLAEAAASTKGRVIAAALLLAWGVNFAIALPYYRDDRAQAIASLRLRPDNIESLTRLVTIALRADDIDAANEALVSLEAALDRAPHTPAELAHGWRVVALARLANEDIIGAGAAATRALEATPNDQDLQDLRAKLVAIAVIEKMREERAAPPAPLADSAS